MLTPQEVQQYQQKFKITPAAPIVPQPNGMDTDTRLKVLFGTPTPPAAAPAAPESPIMSVMNAPSSFGEKVEADAVKNWLQQTKDIAPKIAQDVSEGAKSFQEGNPVEGILKGGGRTAADVAGYIWSPLGDVIGGVTKATGAQDLLDKTPDWYDQAIEKLTGSKLTDIPEVQQFAMKYPNAGEDFGRVLNVLLSAGAGDINPGRMANEAAAVPGNVVNAVREGVDAVGNAMKGTPSAIRDLGDFVTKIPGDVMSPGDAKLRTEIQDVVRKTANNYAGTSRMLSAMEDEHGTNPLEVISSYPEGKALPKLEQGKINPTEAIDYLQEQIGNLSKIKNEALFNNPTQIPVNEFQQYAQDLVSNQGWSKAKQAQASNAVDKIFDDINQAYGDKPLMLPELDKLKTEQAALSNSYTNKAAQPFEYDAHGVVGKAARALIESSEDDVAIQQLNKLIQSHYDAIDLLGSLQGKTPFGGRLTQMYRRLSGEIIGAGAGSTIGHPFIGAVAGRFGADAIDSILHSNIISDPVKAQLIRNMPGVTPKVVSDALSSLDANAPDISDLGDQGFNMSASPSTAPTQSMMTPTGGKMSDTMTPTAKVDQSNANVIKDTVSQGKPDVNTTRAELQSSGHDYDGMIKAGTLPKSAVFKEDGTLQPAIRDHVVSDLAGKLDRFQPGLGAKFTKSAKGGTVESLIKQAQDLLPKAKGGGPGTQGASGGTRTPNPTDRSGALNPLSYEGKDNIPQSPPKDNGSQPMRGFARIGPGPDAYLGESNLTTKLLKDLEGKTTVSKQYIEDATNRPDLKQPERDLFRELLKDEGDKINVKDFANRVKAELLPLRRVKPGGLQDKYENITLPSDLRGPVADYSEHIYSSPIETSAGQVHFSGMNTDNYFAHTRIEDLPALDKVKPSKTKGGLDIYSPTEQADRAAGKWPTGDTRRVIELQSDLFQKGRLEQEGEFHFKEPVDMRGLSKRQADKLLTQKQAARTAEVSKLEPYRNTWHERVIREEVKQAAKDGKTKLQFPTGETAMKIEGLGDNTQWMSGTGMQGQTVSPESLKVGNEIYQGHDDWVSGQNGWIITDVLGDGKFKAVPKSTHDNFMELGGLDNAVARRNYEANAETFDISGKVDTENPIYKFYEKEIGKYLKSKYGAKLITDPQGVTWWELPIEKDQARLPVEAFGVLPFIPQDKQK